MKIVTCKNCKWVSMGITRAQAEKEVDDFNLYYSGLCTQDKEMFGSQSSIDNYKCCDKMDLRLSKEGDCPDSVTLSPVIYEED